jgi:subtilisin family serine protease
MKRLLCLYQAFLGVLTASMLLMVSVAVRAETYIVLYQSNAVPANAAATISAAGGTLLWGYSEIGVAIAQSNNASFANTVKAAAGVLGAAATTGLGARPDGGFAAVDALDASTDAPALGIPAPGDDTLSGLQWDMLQISAPQARAVNGGDPSIVVGDIDTGLDFTHPDLAANVDFANSVSCIGGVPNQNPAAWNDDNGHGTHTAGTIAAAKNGIGIVGVAPNVRIAGIKAGDTPLFFPRLGQGEEGRYTRNGEERRYTRNRQSAGT